MLQVHVPIARMVAVGDNKIKRTRHTGFADVFLLLCSFFRASIFNR